MMRKRAHSRQGSTLLASALGSGGDEDAGVFAVVTPGLPLRACVVPEGFPLGREVACVGDEESVLLLRNGMGVEKGWVGELE